LTVADILQQNCLQTALEQQRARVHAMLPTCASSLATPSHMNDSDHLARLMRPLLLQQMEQQQQELSTQLLIQEQIQLVRARLLAQILSRQA
jgi:hypothetical protein